MIDDVHELGSSEALRQLELLIMRAPLGLRFVLATTHDVRVLVPVHPGFGGTHRPRGLTGAAALAELYNGLIGQLGLDDVTVIGNSLGGWVAAGIALLRSARGPGGSSS